MGALRPNSKGRRADSKTAAKAFALAAAGNVMRRRPAPEVSPRSSADQQIQAGGGSARLTTVEGGTLTASLRGNAVILTDETGGEATVTQADVFQSNGVIHVTDTVSMPN